MAEGTNLSESKDQMLQKHGEEILRTYGADLMEMEIHQDMNAFEE